MVDPIPETSSEQRKERAYAICKSTRNAVQLEMVDVYSSCASKTMFSRIALA
jgi:hypothetical protein